MACQKQSMLSQKHTTWNTHLDGSLTQCVCLAGSGWPKDEVGHGGMFRPKDGTHSALLLFVQRVEGRGPERLHTPKTLRVSLKA